MSYNFTMKQLKDSTYPNLLAEIMESHYSICTIASYMGYRCPNEDDPFIWDKLLGKTEIHVGEMRVLCALFKCSADYLFSDELEVLCKKPMAFYRYYEINKKKHHDMEVHRVVDEITEKVKKSEVFLKFIDLCSKFNEEDIIKLMGSEQKTA